MRSDGARGALAYGVIGVVVASAGPARAQVQSPSAVEREQLGTLSLAADARARARRGDCAGALTEFDEAIKNAIDPTLRRDRGLCHEKLNDPYPAVDDFRAYLSAAPDAPDADDIRDRLARLESSLGLGGSGGGPKRSSTSDDDPWHSSSSTTGSSSTRYDSSAIEEADDSSPLRRGSGGILAPYAGFKRWFAPAASGQTSSLYAEMFGLRLGYSWNETSSIIFEVGYERFNAPDNDPITVSGLALQLGYEARFPIHGMDNNFIFGLAPGFDQLFESTSAVGQSTLPDIGAFYGRLRLGYRHNFGPGAAFEVDLDGGGGTTFVEGSSSGVSGSGQTFGLLGLDIALAFGM